MRVPNIMGLHEITLTDGAVTSKIGVGDINKVGRVRIGQIESPPEFPHNSIICEKSETIQGRVQNTYDIGTPEGIGQQSLWDFNRILRNLGDSPGNGNLVPKTRKRIVSDSNRFNINPGIIIKVKEESPKLHPTLMGNISPRKIGRHDNEDRMNMRIIITTFHVICDLNGPISATNIVRP
jgi:hypothetical protein